MRHINKNRLAQYGLVTGGLIILAGLAGPAQAAGTDSDFRRYIETQCRTNVKFVSVFQNFLLCTNLFQGNDAESLKGRDSIVIPGSGGTTNDRKEPPRPGVQVGVGSTTVSAGAEDGGFGLLLTTMEGEIERSETENENAFDSEMEGKVYGVDYSFSNVLVLGVAVGLVEEEARTASGTGTMATESDSKTHYATLVPFGGLSLDFYSGSSDSDVATAREINVEGLIPIEGLAAASFENTQDFYGASIGYDWYLGDWSLGAFAARDVIETEVEGYAEEGVRTNALQPGEISFPGVSGPGEPTGFELTFPAQSIKSDTTSFGLRASVGIGFDWGSIVPNLKLMQLEEHAYDARVIDVTIAAAPAGTDPFIVQTDEPDRDYRIETFGIVAAFNQGSQIFLEYERFAGHEFIETSSVTLGALIAF